MTTLTETSLWQNLKALKATVTATELKTHFDENTQNKDDFLLSAANLHLDYSRNFLTPELKKTLLELATHCKLSEKRAALFAGEKINATEERAALHTILRAPKNDRYESALAHRELAKMRAFCQQVADETLLGATGKPIDTIVNIGIGGSHQGPQTVVSALSHLQQLEVHFVSNVDAADLMSVLEIITPETTLFLIASKTFTTQETMLNANSAKTWLEGELNTSIANHFVALTSNKTAAQEFGISESHIFEFWDFVGGRYSLWSSIGLSIALSLGFDNFEKLLHAAHEMDNHFQSAPLSENMPVMLALIEFWNQHFLGASSKAILPYSHQLDHFVPYLQQLDMESNGKHITLHGSSLPISSGSIIWGGVGTNGQHAFHQLIHQGTHFIPLDFILPLHSTYTDTDHQNWLVAHCLAQANAHMLGQETANPHQTIIGNKPSNIIYFDTLSPETLGALIALYEHKVFTIAAILDINPFDQYGVELGKQMASSLHQAISSQNFAELDNSTKLLLKMY